ncbi:MAG: RebB family R body protein [Negativicutes bacterium]|jgi:hypothetical protein
MKKRSVKKTIPMPDLEKVVGGADPTLVNPQITDAVRQVNVKTVGESPWESLATAYQSLAHSTALAMENAMNTQSNMQTISTAATNALTAKLLKVEPPKKN